MLTNSFLQLAALSAAGLLKPVAAADDANVYGTTYIQQPPIITTTVIQPPPIMPAPVANASGVEGETLGECADDITACGTTADVLIIRKHKQTIYSTSFKTIESVTTLKPKTRIVTEVVVSTTTTSVEGQCRETIIYEDPGPLIITVEANTTLVREFVPIIPSTTTTTSWVKHKQISQCIIKPTPALGVGAGSTPGAPPVVQPPVVQQPVNPPAPGSDRQHNHDRRRDDPSPAHSPGSTGRSSSSPSASSQQPSAGSGSSPGGSSSTSSSARSRSTP